MPRHALVISMDESIKVGANKCHVKSNPITWHDEEQCIVTMVMLLPIMLVLKKQWCYYLLLHFCLKGHSQVYNVLDINFSERK
jgi:hypothetical protein